MLPKKLQYQIRSLPNKIDVADRSVGSLYEFGQGPPDFGDAFEEREFRYAFIGLEACLINDILAEKYEVPLLDRGEWDPAGDLKAVIEKISKSREREKKAERWWPSSMTPVVPIEQLDARYKKLTADLATANANRRNPISEDRA